MINCPVCMVICECMVTEGSSDRMADSKLDSESSGCSVIYTQDKIKQYAVLTTTELGMSITSIGGILSLLTSSL